MYFISPIKVMRDRNLDKSLSRWDSSYYVLPPNSKKCRDHPRGHSRFVLAPNNEKFKRGLSRCYANCSEKFWNLQLEPLWTQHHNTPCWAIVDSTPQHRMSSVRVCVGIFVFSLMKRLQDVKIWPSVTDVRYTTRTFLPGAWHQLFNFR